MLIETAEQASLNFQEFVLFNQSHEKHPDVTQWYGHFPIGKAQSQNRREWKQLWRLEKKYFCVYFEQVFGKKSLQDLATLGPDGINLLNISVKQGFEYGFCV